MVAVGRENYVYSRACAAGGSARRALGNKRKWILIAGFDIAADVELCKTFVYRLAGRVSAVLDGDIGALLVAEEISAEICTPVKVIDIALVYRRIGVFAAAPVDEYCVQSLGYLDEVVSCASERADLVGNLVYVGIEPEHSRYARLGYALKHDVGGAETPLRASWFRVVDNYRYRALALRLEAGESGQRVDVRRFE